MPCAGTVFRIQCNPRRSLGGAVGRLGCREVGLLDFLSGCGGAVGFRSNEDFLVVGLLRHGPPSWMLVPQTTRYCLVSLVS